MPSRCLHARRNNTDNPMLQNTTYNDTSFTLYLAGSTPVGTNSVLFMRANICPPDGCNSLPPVLIDARAGVLMWSAIETWWVVFMFQ